MLVSRSLWLLLTLCLSAAIGCPLHAAVSEADLSRVAALLQANKDAEARALFVELLKASPNDPQLLTLAKQFGGSADKPRAITLDDLRGPARIRYAAAESVFRELIKDELDEAGRRARIEDYLRRTAALLADHPGLMALWVKRAGLGLDHNLESVGREAAEQLMALDAADVGDARTLALIGDLEVRGWLKPKAVLSPTASDYALTVDYIVRPARERATEEARKSRFTTDQHALATVLSDATREGGAKTKSWREFLQKWKIADDGGPADADRVRLTGTGAVLTENEAMRRQAEERLTAAGKQKAEAARIAAAAEAARLEQLRDSPLKPGKNYVLGSPAMELVWIAPGTFQMGSEYGEPDEKPVHKVTLTAGYWLGKTEVTQAQWQAVMGSNPSDFTGGTFPVENVSWEDARVFCQKLTEQERAAGRLPEGYGYTLPTEAQWEYACRAGSTGDYVGDLDAMAWYGVTSGRRVHVVGNKKANAWGLFDMHGNVWEWCLDRYAAYPGGTLFDPAGATSGARVRRGGSVYGTADDCRSANRNWLSPGDRFSSNGLGFRLALSSVRTNDP